MQKIFSFPVRGPLSGQPLISPAKPTCCYVNTLRIIRYAHKVEPKGEKKKRRGREKLRSRQRGRFIITARARSFRRRDREREFAHPKFAKFEELNLLGGLPPSSPLPLRASYPPPAVCEATNVAKIACVVGPRFCLSLNLTIYTRDWAEGGSFFRLRM